MAAREADLIINIVDASNLERNLYLTSQLLEMKVPVVVAMNMMDVARERGIEINAATLARRLGCPVIPVVGTSGQGLHELKQQILESARSQRQPDVEIPYPAAVERAVDRLLPRIESLARAARAEPRWLAVRLLEGDSLARQIAGAEIEQELAELQAETEAALGDDIDISLADAMGTWLDPLGLNIGEVDDPNVAAESQEVSVDTFGAMAQRFDGQAGAFAYLLFVLLYFPCTAAIAAVYREAGRRWALFVAGWTTGLAYVVATVFYQVAMFSQNPASASFFCSCTSRLPARAVPGLSGLGEY